MFAGEKPGILQSTEDGSNQRVELLDEVDIVAAHRGRSLRAQAVRQVDPRAFTIGREFGEAEVQHLGTQWRAGAVQRPGPGSRPALAP